ncbi:primosomal protein I [Klebsiella pneumoniae]|nr:primosomal protein I [Klebsiella pneumoniae]
MARIRTIKPEFWTDEDMAEVSEPACLLAIGLLNYADDEGYFNANPKLIKAAVFPIREPSVRKRKLTAVCSHQTRIGNLDAHLI